MTQSQLWNDNQKRAPLAEAMRAYAESGALAFHTPGHKQGLGAHQLLKELITPLGLKEEVSLMSELDEPYQPEGCIKDACALAAELWGADRTLFMVNGTTGAIHAMMMATLAEGDEVLVPRNAHRSVMGGLVLTGAVPVWLTPDIDDKLGTAGGLNLQTVQQAIAEHPQAKALIAVCPTYYGISCNLKEIADLLHEHGMLLLVDEAHGAHLRFSDELPPDAISQGADLVAQSTHKLLGSLTQTSMLHICEKNIDYENVRRAAALLTSTSPDYLLLASLDIARMQMAEEGRTKIANALETARYLRDEINKIEGLWCFGKEYIPLLDELKLTVQVSGLGITGHEAEQILRWKYKIQAELADERNVLFIISFADTKEIGSKLLNALQGLATMSILEKEGGPLAVGGFSYSPSPIVPAKAPITPRAAYTAPTKTISFDTSADNISAEEITIYPPGIPLIIPGEIITADLIRQIKKAAESGAKITGPEDNALRTIRVVDA